MMQLAGSRPHLSPRQLMTELALSGVDRRSARQPSLRSSTDPFRVVADGPEAGTLFIVRVVEEALEKEGRAFRSLR